MSANTSERLQRRVCSAGMPIVCSARRRIRKTTWAPAYGLCAEYRHHVTSPWIGRAQPPPSALYTEVRAVIVRDGAPGCLSEWPPVARGGERAGDAVAPPEQPIVPPLGHELGE